MEQIIQGGSSSVPTAATAYQYLFGHQSQTNATITNRTQIIPESGVIDRLGVALDGGNPGGAGKSYTYTIYVNGSPTAITCQISNTATTAEDITHSVNVTAGDRISFEIVPAGTPTNRVTMWGVSFVATAAQRAICMGGTSSATLSTASARYNEIGASEAAWDTTEANRAPVWNITATITSLWARITNAPGAGKSFAFVIMKNGSAEASSTVTISDAAVSNSVTGLSIGISPGDTLSIRATPAGTPAAPGVAYWGMSYTPTTDGEWCMTGVDQNTVSGTRFNSVTQLPLAWSTTDDRLVKAGAASTSDLPTIESVYAKASVAPGGVTTRTLTVDVAKVASALAATIPSGGTTASATSTVTVTRDQAVSIAHTQSGSPAAAFVTVATRFKDNILPVSLTGVAGTGAVGTLGVTHTNALTGVAGTGAVGSLAPVLSISLVGVEATGEVGDLTPIVPTPFTGFVRVSLGDQVITLAATLEADASTSTGGVWVVMKDGVSYAIALVAVDDPSASPVHVRTANGVWAARLYP